MKKKIRKGLVLFFKNLCLAVSRSGTHSTSMEQTIYGGAINALPALRVFKVKFYKKHVKGNLFLGFLSKFLF